MRSLPPRPSIACRCRRRATITSGALVPTIVFLRRLTIVAFLPRQLAAPRRPGPGQGSVTRSSDGAASEDPPAPPEGSRQPHPGRVRKFELPRNLTVRRGRLPSVRCYWCSASWPGPPSSRSLPLPPIRRSLPPGPSRTSSPPLPISESPLLLPTSDVGPGRALELLDRAVDVAGGAGAAVAAHRAADLGVDAGVEAEEVGVVVARRRRRRRRRRRGRRRPSGRCPAPPISVLWPLLKGIGVSVRAPIRRVVAAAAVEPVGVAVVAGLDDVAALAAVQVVGARSAVDPRLRPRRGR